MSHISPLDLNRKLKEVRSSRHDDDVKLSATMTDSTKDQMPKTQSEHAFSMKDRMGSSIPMDNHYRSFFTNTHDKNTTQPDFRYLKLDKDLMSKIMKNDPSIMEKFFEKVVLRPPGEVGSGIRVVHSCDANNNEPVRNNSDEIHHHDDSNIDSVKVVDAADDGVKVVVAAVAADADGGKVVDGDDNGGDEAGIRSLPYKKHGPYTCPKCMAVFTTSQKFAAHTSSHYKYETKDEKRKRKKLKTMRRNKKKTNEIQQQFMDNAAGGEGSTTLHEVKVEYQPHDHNNDDAPPGFPVPLGARKIKMEPFP
ncbi:hypothetical protein PIB30_098300 [Stylosanthes scabra]|uniref:C2H2-type domain-containing protein n=1 Tax=Stylosanthes scabra TaxID=79078 RepID=A0ABU6VUZ0_9FABA|nr:hypothetical protein [Stylosanthes scabra]